MVNNLAKVTITFTVATATLLYIPSLWCSRDAKKWLTDDNKLQVSLAKGVENWLTKSLHSEDFKTHSTLFNNEWLFGPI